MVFFRNIPVREAGIPSTFYLISPAIKFTDKNRDKIIQKALNVHKLHFNYQKTDFTYQKISFTF